MEKVRFRCKHTSFFFFLGVGNMKQIEGQIRIPSGCAIAAVISREGRLMSGEKIIASMKPMHERSNGLGGRVCRLRNLSGVSGLFCPAYVSG